MYLHTLLFCCCCLQLKWTPVFAAAWKGHKDIVECLLREKSCSCDVVDVVSWCIHCFNLQK